MADIKTCFTKEDPWRVFRIMSEFVDGFEELADLENAVSFFGSARTKPSARYYRLAEKTAFKLAKAGFAVITGAGSGIMEAANKGAKKAGGKSIGLNILIPCEQTPNRHVTRLIDFKYFFCRKVMFVKYARAFVVFPGGYGTMDELFEALSLIQTRRIEPFPVILVGKEYWKGLLGWLRGKLLKSGAISKQDLSLFIVEDDPEKVVKHIRNYYSK